MNTQHRAHALTRDARNIRTKAGDVVHYHHRSGISTEETNESLPLYTHTQRRGLTAQDWDDIENRLQWLINLDAEPVEKWTHPETGAVCTIDGPRITMSKGARIVFDADTRHEARKMVIGYGYRPGA